MKRLITLMSTVGLLSIMFTAPTAAAMDKVFVCKVVGGPGHYSLQTGNNPIHVAAASLGSGVNPVIGALFNDAQPSFVVASDSRELCVAGLPPVDRESSVTAPVFTAGTCLAPGSVVATDTAAYTWSTSGPDNARKYTAVARTGFTLTGRTTWTFDLRQLRGDSCQADRKVWVCKIVGGPGNYSVKEGKNPIEVSENALNKEFPGIGNQFSDAQPSYLVESKNAVCAVPDEFGTPVKPAFTAGTCLAAGKVVATETDRYSWTTNGPDSAKVYTAVAKTGYTLTGTTSWTFDVRQLSGPVCSVVQETPVTAPILTAGTCLAAGKVVATETDRYSWTTNGPDSARVYTAVAKPDYTLTGTTSWTFDLRKLPTQTVNPLGACYVAPAALDAVQVLGVSETAPIVAGASQSLAFTGVSWVIPLVIVGLLALVLGGVLTAAASRRVHS